MAWSEEERSAARKLGSTIGDLLNDTPLDPSIVFTAIVHCALAWAHRAGAPIEEIRAIMKEALQKRFHDDGN